VSSEASVKGCPQAARYKRCRKVSLMAPRDEAA
jgi:hypothetical protein